MQTSDIDQFKNLVGTDVAGLTANMLDLCVIQTDEQKLCRPFHYIAAINPGNGKVQDCTQSCVPVMQSKFDLMLLSGKDDGLKWPFFGIVELNKQLLDVALNKIVFKIRKQDNTVDSFAVRNTIDNEKSEFLQYSNDDAIGLNHLMYEFSQNAIQTLVEFHWASEFSKDDGKIGRLVGTKDVFGTKNVFGTVNNPDLFDFDTVTQYNSFDDNGMFKATTIVIDRPKQLPVANIPELPAPALLYARQPRSKVSDRVFYTMADIRKS